MSQTNLKPLRATEQNPEQVEFYQRLAAERILNLGEEELWWRDHQLFLQSRGYMLRQRLRPGWVPSWLGNNMKPSMCEDSFYSIEGKVMDAVRMEDGNLVAIKRVNAKSTELSVLRFLANPLRSQDPTNHCAPMIEEFYSEDEPSIVFVVMPRLRVFDDPPFYAVGEVVDCIVQMLEGLEFLHRNNIAHRDCARGNIMFDPTLIYPQGYHPVLTMRNLAGSGYAEHRRRIDVKETKYYFIDFSISVLFDDPSEPRLAFGCSGQDQDPPELQSDDQYDPFALDVFILGNLFRKSFLEKFSNVEFIRPLAELMTQADPNARPTISEVLAKFKPMAATRQGLSHRWRLRPREETGVSRLLWDAGSFARIGLHVVQSVATGKVFKQSTGAQHKKG